MDIPVLERFLEILAIAPDIKDKEDAVSVDHLEGKISLKMYRSIMRTVRRMCWITSIWMWRQEIIWR